VDGDIDLGFMAVDVEGRSWYLVDKLDWVGGGLGWIW
jgi:hypothetical protein